MKWGKRFDCGYGGSAATGSLCVPAAGESLRTTTTAEERAVRDLAWSGFRATVVIEVYRVRCPDCGVKAERIEQLPSKAPFSKRLVVS